MSNERRPSWGRGTCGSGSLLVVAFLACGRTTSSGTGAADGAVGGVGQSAGSAGSGNAGANAGGVSRGGAGTSAGANAGGVSQGGAGTSAGANAGGVSQGGAGTTGGTNAAGTAQGGAETGGAPAGGGGGAGGVTCPSKGPQACMSYVQSVGPAVCSTAYAACSADTHCANMLADSGCYSTTSSCHGWDGPTQNLWESYIGCVTCAAPCFDAVCPLVSGPCVMGAGGAVAQGCQNGGACLPGPGCEKNLGGGDCARACYCTGSGVYGCADHCGFGGGNSGPPCSSGSFCANGTSCDEVGGGCAKHCDCVSSVLVCTSSCGTGGTSGTGGTGSGGLPHRVPT